MASYIDGQPLAQLSTAALDNVVTENVILDETASSTLEEASSFASDSSIMSSARWAIPSAFRPLAPTGSAKICAICRAMSMQALLSDKGFQHVGDLRILNTSASECAVCNLLRACICQCSSSVQAENPDIAGAMLSIARTYGVDFSMNEPWSLTLKLSKHLSGIDKIKILLTVPKTKPVNPHTSRTGLSVIEHGHLLMHYKDPEHPPPLVPRGSEAEVLRRLSAWLDKSASEASVKVGLPISMPTRILDLGEGLSGTSNIRLRESADLRAQYITLSYCWGSYTACNTLQHNVRDRKEAISYVDLPLAFADAVRLTRGLGIRYLWIDALCIIQDDPTDWLNEASQMGEIYGQAYCRLAATSTKSPTESFFPPSAIIASVVLQNFKQTASDDLHPLDAYLTLPKRYTTDIDYGYLNSRGWVLQERLLSPRTIHFTHNHIYCEDLEDRCGEDWVRERHHWPSCVEKSSTSSLNAVSPEEKLLQSMLQSMDTNDDKWVLQGFLAKGGGEQIPLLPLLWLQIAEAFSRSQMTHKEEKWIAINGLIERKQQNHQSPHFGSQNFIGLWERTLHVELCWARPGPIQLLFLGQMNLPTWSWLAHDGPITFAHVRRSLQDQPMASSYPKTEIELLDFDVPHTATLLPLVKIPSLYLRTRLRAMSKFTSDPVQLSFPERWDAFRDESPFDLSTTGYIPEYLPSKSKSRGMLDNDGASIGYVSFDKDCSSVSESRLCCALISTIWENLPPELTESAGKSSFTWPNPRSQGDRHSHPILAYGLVLQGVHGHSDSMEYRRVGLVQANYEWISKGKWKNIKLV